ncbi:hypothetical protein X726_31795 [Mesorhizobium sp. L103C105A0]|nr:hypothetical protein X726_31795 [Mesorhizobium sp. L103C105A0]
MKILGADVRLRFPGSRRPPGYDNDVLLERLLFRRVGRPPQDLDEPDWAMISRELKRKA